MRSLVCFALAAFLSGSAPAQSPDTSSTPAASGAAQPTGDAAAQNAQKARAMLDAMVRALGGQKWLEVKNREQHGRVAGFYHGKPNLGTLEVTEFHMWPDHDRMNVDKHGDWVELFEGDKGWEITYRGKKPMEQPQVDDFIRRRNHSIEIAIKVWLNDPRTILVYEGQHLAERHLADQVTLISPENEAVTIQTDADSHLPLRRSFRFRDPDYHDFITDSEEYDDYHDMNGLPTPLRISRFRNDEMVRQFYIDRVAYNQELAPGFWDVDTLARHIKR
jgi:hypothetical protein